MADAAPSLRIGGLTVRGRAITAEHGRAIATALAPALAGRVSANLDHLTLRLPASAIASDGSIDPATLSTALDGGRHG